MKINIILLIVMCLAGSRIGLAQDQADGQGASFNDAAATAEQQLDRSLRELAELREQAAEQTIPLSRKLSALESELIDVRLEYQKTSRLLDTRTLDLSNLRNEIKSRKDEAAYLSNLLAEYIRNFESGLHIAELQRYRERLREARDAPGDANLTQQQIYAAQTDLVATSLDRLNDALGGTRFKGTAVDEGGNVETGTFAMIGPSALFGSEDGSEVGTAEQRLGSLEPGVQPFANPGDAAAAAELVREGKGRLPFDPTLGNAHAIEATKDTLLEQIQKGGAVMYPIFIIAGAAALVALYKWLALAFVRMPSRRGIRELLEAVGRRDRPGVVQITRRMGGPVGRMLEAGAEHLDEPRELIEEVMYEKVLSTRLKLQRMLPVIAVTASSAPLLGLLGTVTGIIKTFDLMSAFGGTDVKQMSGGISEALITTMFGLIVAIPSLLAYAFLSRKAKGIVDEMEKTAVTFINQVAKSKGKSDDGPTEASPFQPQETAPAEEPPDAEPDPGAIQPGTA